MINDVNKVEVNATMQLTLTSKPVSRRVEDALRRMGVVKRKDMG